MIFRTLTFLICLTANVLLAQNNIPLPEHPRPDFLRSNWQNLNGRWDFAFDSLDVGIREKWFSKPEQIYQSIQVPFSWAAPLSGQKDLADIAWYHKKIKVPLSWSQKRTFIVIGASDWETSVYLDGKLLGKHQGGYTPFSFDLTPYLKYDTEQSIVVRVDDKRRDFTLYGKQGYGNARGMWQTVYLESRGQDYVESYQITPDIDKQAIHVKALFPQATSKALTLKTHIQTKEGITFHKEVPAGSKEVSFTIPVPKPHLWTLEDPFLYNYQVVLGDGDIADSFTGYFGMRKISAEFLPNSDIAYVYLNNKPIYLKLALDQSYHPDGFYTFPSDQFMYDEIVRSKKIGLNGIRTHIKAEIPRKLYWADKLGLLVMADLPNSWGEPGKEMRKESEFTLREMIKRDFNHPAIFSWIVFNETWGLTTKVEVNGKKKSVYLPDTQKWVTEMYRLTKSLDASRIVEDNSICCGFGHTETDLHSWHSYLPGYEWDAFLKKQSDSTYKGSTWNFEKGYKQDSQPMINSEFGNVWGYDGSTGDVDYTFDYHKAMNAFRNNLRVAGWLYTEHHDVINEWNGYYRFDRTEKETGLGEIVKDMSLKDLHSDFYLSTGQEITFAGNAGDRIKIPLTFSALTDKENKVENLQLKMVFEGKTAWGSHKKWWEKSQDLEWNPWSVKKLDSLEVELPADRSINTLKFIVQDSNGGVVHQNFVHVIVEKGNIQPDSGKHILLEAIAEMPSATVWNKKDWKAVDGHKLNGAGSGYFEYEFEWPRAIPEDSVSQVSFFAELSPKPLLGKDRVDSGKMDGDYMLGKGTFDPGKNPNAYPQTDSVKNPGFVQIYANGRLAGSADLPDDPADHQGVLSWHYQPRNHKLNEAGTYGYWVQVNIPKLSYQEAVYTGKLKIKLEVPDGYSTGLAVYGTKSGRYMINPSLLIRKK